jgi:ubiquitin C-terminal hydrolase
LSGCNKIGFSRHISNNIQTSNFIEILPVVAELFHVAGQTDGHNEAKSRFRNFENAPENSRK